MNRWTEEKANAWYKNLPWMVGCNFIPSTAINQLEMWQADTFDAMTIDRELGWAADLGMNTVRVYLHDVVWETDEAGFTSRMDCFLDCAAKHGIRPICVVFDDCWNANPKAGRQPEPVPGVHNSGWLQSPGAASVNNPAAWRPLENYVRGVIGRFRGDARILMWDLYNEPGNTKQDERSLPLLCKVFEWARDANPIHPLTAGLWYDNAVFNSFQLAASDVVTFHNYSDAAHLAAQIGDLRRNNRPLICTEWLRRGLGDVAACLPVFHREKVGCCNWGLVSGKTQTIFPWGSPQGVPEPSAWFHDLLKSDGSPHNPAEARLFKTLTKGSR
ncbi:MAG: cellulase family glycosylhydrolase [Planctomycetota bacterium]